MATKAKGRAEVSDPKDQFATLGDVWRTFEGATALQQEAMSRYHQKVVAPLQKQVAEMSAKPVPWWRRALARLRR